MAVDAIKHKMSVVDMASSSTLSVVIGGSHAFTDPCSPVWLYFLFLFL